MDKFQLQNNPGRTALIEGKEWLFFSGYDYLGIQQHPQFVALVKEGIDKYGWIFPSSRISNTQLPLFEAFENYISEITGFEACIILSSGFLAGELATSLWKDELHNLQPSHPAIERSMYERNKKRLAFDSVDIFRANIIRPSQEVIEQAETIVVDDSHGFGLLGNEGEGYSAFIDQKNKEKYLLCFSLSKAWSINGGVVCGSKSVIEKLRTNHRYTAATAPSPALLYAAMNARDIYQSQLEKLRSNIAYLRTKNLCLSSNKHLPVFILPPNISEERLRPGKIIISSFAYPDPNGQKLNRIILNSLHTEADMDFLIEAISEE